MFGAPAGFGDLSRGVGELFVRHRQRDVVHHRPSDGKIAGTERPYALRPERQTEFLIAHRRVHGQHGPVAGGDEAGLQIRRFDDRERLVRQVVDHAELGVEFLRAGELHAGELRELVVRRRLDHDLIAIVERHRHAVVSEDLVDDFRDTREHRADVEDAGDLAQQLDGALEVAGALALDGGGARGFGEPLVGQGDGDVVGQALHQRQIAGCVRIRALREQREHAGRLVFDPDRRADARLQPSREARAGCEQAGLRQIAEHAAIFPAQELGRAVGGAREHAEARAVLGQQREVRFVVRHDAVRDLAETPEDVAHVERARQRGQQIVKGLEAARLGGRFVEHRDHERCLVFVLRAVLVRTLIGSTAAISRMRS